MESVLPEAASAPRDTYYNARLDPKNYLEGPLSWNASTRLRQMLARPGIVVSATTSYSEVFRSDPKVQVAPGICDGISARCALEAGFDCMYQRYGIVLKSTPYCTNISTVERPRRPLALASPTWPSRP